MKFIKLLRHLVSFILPITVLIIVPFSIENNFSLAGVWSMLLGSIFICIGLLGIILTVRMFVLIGKGTLAPWDPTKKLVTNNLYGYVRNPMILAVFVFLVGEAILFASLSITIWAIIFFIINTIYFILSEEPALEKRFGTEYLDYKQNVPRWIPKIKPWGFQKNSGENW